MSGAGGSSIFQALARYLATIIGSDWVFIAVRDSERARCMRVLALWRDGELAENFDYDLRGTPCETVIGQQVRIYPQGLPQASPASQGMSPERLQHLSTAMRAAADAGKVAGTVTLVARNGKVVHYDASGHRDVESGQTMTPDTIFRIASMSKAACGWV